MTDEQPGPRVTHVTWNLVATGLLGALAVGEVVASLMADPSAPVLWVFSALVLAALVWAVWQRHRRPTWLLPRLYLFTAVPVWLGLLVTDAMTAFWLGAIWLVVIPILLSGDWLDRWLGVPTSGPAPTSGPISRAAPGPAPISLPEHPPSFPTPTAA